MHPTYFPLHDFGPLMKGMIIGGLGIFHVFLAQFAIGGGLLMCYFQWLAQSGRDESGAARRFLDGYFRVIILISFVLGAVTGVAMWFTTIQISPRTIGVMVDQFHWVWAIEYLFFWLEVVAGYAFYRYGPRLSDHARMRLLVLYSLGAWLSLFWINGIISWQLTPAGDSAQEVLSPGVWRGFFNPSFFPSTLFRTVTSMVIAGLAGGLVVHTMTDLDREAKRKLINRCAHFMVPMLLMPILGAWYLAVIPADSRSWLLGGSAAMTMFMNLTVGASVLIGAYALIGLWRQRLYINHATAALLLALAFGATAGGEFVREGVRKPYTIRQALYSNSISPDQVRILRVRGSVTDDPYPLLNPQRYPNDQVRLGAKVFRFQCSVCHTETGVNGVSHLAGSWSEEQKRLNIAQLQRTKTFMPPFAGTPEELEALVQWISWTAAGRPQVWADTSAKNEYLLLCIMCYLEQAGTERAR